MINIIHDIKNIKNSNFLYLITNKKELNNLKTLDLQDSIIKKIQKLFKDGKNTKISFFLGKTNIETLTVFFYFGNKQETLIEFLGDKLIKLNNNITIGHVNNLNINIYIELINVLILSRYKFNKYKSEKQEETINIIINKDNKNQITTRLKTIENIIFARDLGETPSNDLYPESFVQIVKNIKFKKTKIKILNSKQLQKKGLNLLYNVGKGSSNQPYMIIFERITDKKLPTIGMVGKGITFDTGGIQVKSGDHMYEMKGDMCGAANLLSIIKELDNKKLNYNLVCSIVLAENNISSNSYKPSDIIQSYSKKTVDIIHTDAEGRLVLADGISYISKNYKLNKIISLATLTGAVMVALGYRYAGIMGNDDKLIKKFINYSDKNFEKYVRLPYDNYFIKKTKSNIADLENLNKGVHAGSSMGAAFLSNFILNNESYTHIDIAGPAINTYEAYGLFNKGMTGFGVDSISDIITEL